MSARARGAASSPRRWWTRWIDEHEPEWMAAVRAVFALAVPFAASARWGEPGLQLAALGAWLGLVADPGGARRERLAHMLAYTAVASALFGAALAIAAHRAPSLIALALIAIGASLLRAMRPTVATLATLFVVVFTIAIELRSARPWTDAAYFGAGALWATLLSSAVWPVRRHAPLRRALAAVYDALAQHSHALAIAIGSGDAKAIDAVRDEHPRKVRDAIEAARTVAVRGRAQHRGATAIGTNLRTLLGFAESAVALIVTITEQHEHDGLDPRSTARALRWCAARLERTRRALLRADARARALPSWREQAPAPHDVVARLCDGVGFAAEVARTIARPAEARFAPLSVEPPSWRDDLAAARAALTWSSPHLRHGVRVAIAAVLAMLVGQAISQEHRAWITVTTVVILQPYPSASWRRAGERLVGTLLGCLLAQALALLARSGGARSIALMSLAALAMASRARSYRLFTLFLTPIFVLLARKGPHDWMTGAERMLDALIGSAIALVAVLGVAPSWERERVGAAMGKALDALLAYADRVLREPAQSSEALRRDGAIALNEADSSLERWLAEPLSRPSDAARTVLIASQTRHLFSSLVALAASPRGEDATDRAAVATYIERVAALLRARLERDERASAAPERPTLTGAQVARLSAIVRDAAVLASVCCERDE